MSSDQSRSELALRAGPGRQALFSQLLAEHRARLRATVDLRLDRRLRGRIDPSDVIQEAYLEAAERLEEFLAHPQMPFFVWLRLITLQRMAILYRRHLGTQSRDVSREVSLFDLSLPDEASTVLADQLFGRDSSPSEAAERRENRELLERALAELDPIDREVLILRHFEELTNLETAAVLDLKPTAASNRYVRALKRLQEVVQRMAAG